MYGLWPDVKYLWKGVVFNMRFIAGKGIIPVYTESGIMSDEILYGKIGRAVV